MIFPFLPSLNRIQYPRRIFSVLVTIVTQILKDSDNQDINQNIDSKVKVKKENF